MKNTTEVSFILLESCPCKEEEFGSMEKYKVYPLIYMYMQVNYHVRTKRRPPNTGKKKNK